MLFRNWDNRAQEVEADPDATSLARDGRRVRRSRYYRDSSSTGGYSTCAAIQVERWAWRVTVLWSAHFTHSSTALGGPRLPKDLVARRARHLKLFMIRWY
jgi:hypothetical protein